MPLIATHNEYIWEPVAVPNSFKKHQIIWMTHAECRRYSSGIVFIQQYFSAHHHICYCVSETTYPINIAYTIPYEAIAFHYQLKGKNSLYVKHAELLWLNSNHYTAYPIMPGNLSVTLQAGITESVMIATNTQNMQTLLSNFDHIQQLLSPGLPSDNITTIPLLPIDAYIESIIQKELFTNITNRLLHARIKTSVFHLIGHYEWQLASDKITAVPLNKYYHIINEIKQEIETNPNRLLQTEKYFAKKYVIGEVTMQRYFKLTLGTTLAAYRHKHCMLKAKELLYTGESIGNISDTLGYSDPANFTKAFRDYFGHPPSIYRKGT
ncbi:AraC-type DNA-binding protein [Filimonas lacunae]|uniref:AraC-type DNA-binding protein n=2 Tax=Filimonas lacunae TaxID=477680 RepID=A0A1N7NYR8_9BACT|nr:AraC-type DNA-binding protein [Filimonas lacunae]